MTKTDATSITSVPIAKPRRKRKSAAKYQCPEILAKWLERLRAFDPNENLLWFDMDNEFAEDLGLQTVESEKTLKRLFDTLCEAMIEKGVEIEDITQSDELLLITRKRSINDYLEFCVIRYGLRKIAEYYAGKGPFPLLVPSQLEKVPGSSKLKAVPKGLAEVIENAECERIRICEECTHLFWAKRKESKTCSRKCLNVVTVRAHRTRVRAMTPEELAERKRQLRKNREHNQKLKGLRKKKSGAV